MRIRANIPPCHSGREDEGGAAFRLEAALLDRLVGVSLFLLFDFGAAVALLVALALLGVLFADLAAVLADRLRLGAVVSGSVILMV